MNITPFHTYFLDIIKPIIDSIAPATKYASPLTGVHHDSDYMYGSYGVYTGRKGLYSTYTIKIRNNLVTAKYIIEYRSIIVTRRARFKLSADDAHNNTKLINMFHMVVSDFKSLFNDTVRHYQALSLL